MHGGPRRDQDTFEKFSLFPSFFRIHSELTIPTLEKLLAITSPTSTKTTMMNQIEQEIKYDELNASVSSLDLDDLVEDDNSVQQERQLSGIKRCVFVEYGMRSLMIKTDVDENLSEVMKTVEGKTGIPMEEQVLTLNGSRRQIDGDKSLRNYGYMCGAFCTLSSRA